MAALNPESNEPMTLSPRSQVSARPVFAAALHARRPGWMIDGSAPAGRHHATAAATAAAAHHAPHHAPHIHQLGRHTRSFITIPFLVSFGTHPTRQRSHPP